MGSGYITSHIDVAQVVLYIFWIFFAGLIIHLRREDKREGYPLDSDRSDRAPRVPVIGFPAPPPPKTFHMPFEEEPFFAPHPEVARGEIQGVYDSTAPLRGMPLEPTGNPMRDGVGPASFAMRRDIPDVTIHGTPKIVPMRVAVDYQIAPGDPDPRGMPVVGADGIVAGICEDLWVDRAEPRILYFQVALADDLRSDYDNAHRDADDDHTPILPGSVMLPVGFAKVQARHNRIRAVSVLGAQFAFVPPTLRNADFITRLEEDRITAYFAGGQLYAQPSRQEPLV